MMLSSQSSKIRRKDDPEPARREPDLAEQKPWVSPLAHCVETCLTVTPLPGEGVMEIFTRLAIQLKELDASIAHTIVYGSIRANNAGLEAMRRLFGPIEWPVTWVEGGARDDVPIAGVQAFAVAGATVHPIRIGGRVVSSVFDSGPARHCVIGGLGFDWISTSRTDQTRQAFDCLETILHQAGFTMADVIRTWFFLDDLLSWYGDFNLVRTQRYSVVRFCDGSLPASTGVAARNPAGAALAVAAVAVRPLDSSVRIEPVQSPLQCPAPDYGSSFSRAIEISSRVGRQLLISGTAAISEDGRSLAVGDVRRQIDITMEVIEAILRSRGMNFSDLTRATAYFKRIGDAAEFFAWCAKHDLVSLPVVLAQCDICRDELLFELEADAWTVGTT